MSDCYVCTKPTGTKLNGIPFCAGCMPASDPRVPDPRETPPMHSLARDVCPVRPGGYCNGRCLAHNCTSDFCTC